MFLIKKYLKSSTFQITSSALLWVAAVYYLIWDNNYLVGVDAYYHIQLAEIMKKSGLVLNGFPWADCSTWKYHFFDKEWLFHIYLIPFLVFGKITGAKLSILFSSLIVCVSWGVLLKCLKLKNIFFFLILMFFISGYGFTSRLVMCRAHVLSIAIVALVICCLVKRNKLFIFLVSIIYFLTYAGAWQVIPLVAIYDIIYCSKNKKFKFTFFLTPYAVSGSLIGLVINPYFPQNIYGLYIQNYFVLKSKWFGMDNVVLSLGNELNSLGWYRLLKQFFLYALLLVLTMINFFKVRLNATVNLIYLSTLSLIYFILMMLSFRFCEYSIPIAVVFIAAFWDHRICDWKCKKYYRITLTVAYIFLFFVFVKSALDLKGYPERFDPQYSEITRALKKSLTQKEKTEAKLPGKIVFTGGWDDAPILFFGAPQFRYLVFLDPSFMYNYSPEKYKEWDRIANGKVLTPAFLIKSKFNADYIFITAKHTRLMKALDRSKYAKSLCVGPEGEKLYRINISQEQLDSYLSYIRRYSVQPKK